MWSQEDVRFLIGNYADSGAAWVADKLGKTLVQVRSKANKINLKLSKEASHRIIHDRAAEHMRTDNPSRRPGATERLTRQSKARMQNPEHARKFFGGHAKLQRENPSGLEKKLAAILDKLGVAYEHHVVIKLNFVVDFVIGKLVIEADGDWWHGHPRFEPLKPRQIAQRKRDLSRNKYLEACGYIVIRIWESDMRFDVVKNHLENQGIKLPAISYHRSI